MDKKRITKKLRRLAAIGLAGGLLLCHGAQISVNANTLKDVFDEHYYADTYKDLKENFGYNREALWNHYMQYGLAEGRNMNALINVVKYKQQYADLNAAFGDDWDAYINHYLTVGAKEGRESGTDNEFNAFDYAARYADLQTAFGNDVLALWKHYQTTGILEGRDARPEKAITAENEAVGEAEEGTGTEETPGSEETQQPQVTPEPEQTQQPQVTPEPEQTQQPQVTPEPEQTQQPQVTPEPEQTQQPQVTPEPEQTQQPQVTPKPEETQQPNIPSTDQTPAVSNNINSQNYRWYNNYNWNWAETVKSYLCENQNGGLTRVEYIDGQIVVEDYNNNFELCTSQNIPVELPIWGGFFAGENYNFLIFGQENPSEDDNMEVVRVVKYSKTWERLGQASLYGANTVVPFEAGSLRCAEYGDYLYIRTCHKMYASLKDGLNHQANLTIAVCQSDMAITDSYYIVMNSTVGYVSHSFNQFVLVDQDQNIITLDHGDAHPRGIVVMRYNQAKAGGEKFSGKVTSSSLVDFPGQTGDNYTGASVGGFAETASGYVTAFNYDSVGGNGTREIYIGYTTKDGMESTVNKITESDGMLTPVLASTGLDGGFLMWNDADGAFYYLSYTDKGEVGSIATANAALSDCRPICHDGKIVWYVTSNSVPEFFELDVTSGMITATTANEK